jgi:DNA-binding MarR family transcriptional regulator
MTMDRAEIIEQLASVNDEMMRYWKAALFGLLKDEDITPAQMGVLMMLKAGHPQMGKSLAEQMHMTRSSVTQLVDDLVEKGYVKREQDSRDRRVVHLLLTATGQDKIVKLKEKRKQVLAMFSDVLSDEELRADLEHQRKVLAQAKKINEAKIHDSQK